MSATLQIRPKVRLLFRGAETQYPYDLKANEPVTVQADDIPHIDKNDFEVISQQKAAGADGGEGKPKEIGEMTVKELQAFALEQKIEIPVEVKKKEEIAAFITSEVAKRAANAPPPGTDQAPQ